MGKRVKSGSGEPIWSIWQPLPTNPGLQLLGVITTAQLPGIPGPHQADQIRTPAGQGPEVSIFHKPSSPPPLAVYD